MDLFSKIDRQALTQAGDSLECFGVLKTSCIARGYDFYDIMWAFYCMHADHLPSARNRSMKWDGSPWGHIEKVKQELDIQTLGDKKAKTLVFCFDRFVPDVTKDEFTAFIKKLESGDAKYFGRVSDFHFYPSEPLIWLRIFN